MSREKTVNNILNDMRDALSELWSSEELVMPKSWPEDIALMHSHFGVHEAVERMDEATLRELLDFRVRFLREELDELERAAAGGDAEGVVDALVDLCVVAIGTLDMFDVDAEEAWDAVRDANMAKEVGVKEGRPNPLGLPDLVKPEGWQAPSHDGNHGLLGEIFGK